MPGFGRAGGGEKPPNHLLDAVAIGIWLAVVLLMEGGNVFGDRTGGLTVVAFFLWLACWTTLRKRW